MPLSCSIREIAQSHRAMEQELAHAVNDSSKAMERVYGKPRTAEVLGLFGSGSSSPLQPLAFHMDTFVLLRG